MLKLEQPRVETRDVYVAVEEKGVQKDTEEAIA